MFLFSLLISIILYFSFFLKILVLITQILQLLLKNGATIGATILFIIIVVFLMYANHLFIKRRTKEFALYQLDRFNTWKYSKNAQYRTTSIFIVTGILGTLIGIFGSKLLLVIASKLMKLNTHISIGFEPCYTYYRNVSCRFLLIMIQNYIFLKTQHFSFDERQLYPGSYPKRITEANRRHFRNYNDITDVVFTSSIMHRMKKNAMSLTVIAIISAFTVSILASITHLILIQL